MSMSVDKATTLVSYDSMSRMDLVELVERLKEQAYDLMLVAERVRSDISDQDTGSYYQLGNQIEKMNRLVRK